MKLSKQERIGALIIIVILILALGGWLLVKPSAHRLQASSRNMTRTLQSSQERLLSDRRSKKHMRKANTWRICSSPSLAHMRLIWRSERFSVSAPLRWL